MVDARPPISSTQEPGEPLGWAVSPAGASAQAEYERRRARNVRRIRRQWPYALAFAVVTCLLLFAVADALTGNAGIAVVLAVALAVAHVTGFLQLSTTSPARRIAY